MAEGFVTRRGGGGIDVSDATATENDVLQGETFYSGDTNIKTGNIPSKGAETFTPGTTNQTISSGQYLSGTQTILGDPDLVPENIKDGVSIFGVTGTLPQPTYYLSFDGVDDRVSFGNESLFEGMSYLEVETQIRNFIGGPRGNIVDKFWDNSNRSWELRYDLDGNLKFGVSTNLINGNNYAIFNNTSSLNDSEWVTVKGIWSSSDQITRIYVDGVQGSSNNVSGSTVRTNNSPLSFGISWYGGSYAQAYQGDIKYVKISDENGVIGEWNFTEGSGTTLNDSVGNTDGTIVGATWGQG